MTQQIRVLHVCHDLVGGGAEKQLRLLLAMSRSHDMEPAVLCVNTSGLTETDINCQIYQFDRRAKLDLRIFSFARRVVHEFRPDILHLWLPPVVTIPALVAAALARVPCVYSFRSVMYFETALHVPEFVLVLAFANKIVSNNPAEQSRPLYRWAYRIKHGEQIDNAIANSARPVTYDRDKSSRPVIIFAGRIAPVKNLRCLLNGFARLRHTENCELLLCGAGEQSADIATAINDLALGQDVQMLGYRDDVLDLMSRSDVFVLPSLYEGSPNAVLEACAAGLPLVLSDIPGHRLFSDAGAALIFDPQSPNALAEALARVLREPHLRDSLIENTKRVIRNRDPGQMTAKYYEAYKDSIRRY